MIEDEKLTVAKAERLITEILMQLEMDTHMSVEEISVTTLDASTTETPRVYRQLRIFVRPPLGAWTIPS